MRRGCDERFEKVVEMRGELILGGANMRDDDTCRVIFGRFVSFDSNGRRRSDGARWVDTSVERVVDFAFLVEIAEFVLNLSFIRVGVLSN